MSYMLKIIKYTIFQLEIVVNITFKQILNIFSNMSARIRNVITTNIDINISFMKFKHVFKLYFHKNEVIFKYTQ